MTTEAKRTANPTHNAPEFRHPSEMDWEMGRFNNVTKFLFHPTPERPTVPNAGFLRYEPGAGFPLHKHDFAQVWYIIDGEFQMGERKYGPARLSTWKTRISRTRCGPRPAAPSCSSSIPARRPAGGRFTRGG